MKNAIRKAWLCASGSAPAVPKFIVQGNDTCRIYKSGGRSKACVIAFDGSNDLKDWISNFRAGKTDDTHKGFFNSFALFTEKVGKYIMDHDFSTVIFTGHSRGGALATVAARYFIDTGLLGSCSCITFGSPRVGNRVFRDEYNRLPIDHTNYINGWDIVTYLPPAAFGNRRVGKNVRLKRPWYRKLLLTFRAKDHFMKSYNKSLNKLWGL